MVDREIEFGPRRGLNQPRIVLNWRKADLNWGTTDFIRIPWRDLVNARAQTLTSRGNERIIVRLTLFPAGKAIDLETMVEETDPTADTFGLMHSQFLQMEEDLNLFDWSIDGFPVWERIRFKVHRMIMDQSGVLGQAHPRMRKDARDFLTGGYLWARNLLDRNPYFASDHDVLIWGSHRRQRREDGTWWDNYFDPLLEATPLDYVMVEDDYNLTHRTPPRTENLRYIDLITFASTIYRTFTPGQPGSEEPLVARFEDRIRDEFGLSIDVGTLVYEEITDRRVYLPLYRRLLRRVDPSVVLLVISYGKESFVEACRHEDIPVVELQHGTIGRFQPGYAMPEGRQKRDAPDYLFSFGEFWHRDVQLPMDDEHVFDVGYLHLDQSHEKYANQEQTDEIVFISQGTIGTQLSKLAVEMSERSTIDRPIVFKVHPGVAGRWRRVYPWLHDSEVLVVGDETPIYQLLGRASYQVGVYSMAVFEGMRFGLNTVLVGLPGIQYMSRLIDEFDVPVVSDAKELETAIREINDQEIDWTEFFEPDPQRNFHDALDEVIGRR